MSDRALPYACNVANRVIAELVDHGAPALAAEVASVNRATCDLVHALHSEHEAATHSDQLHARTARVDAITRLRAPSHADDADTPWTPDEQAAVDHLRALLAQRQPNPARVGRHIGILGAEGERP